MSYQVNRWQAERLAASLDNLRTETDRYLARMSILVREALDEEGKRSEAMANMAVNLLADNISDTLHPILKDVVEAVSEHYDIADPTGFEWVAMARAA